VNAHDPKAVAPVFDPARLKLAREARGLKKGGLAREVGVTPAAIGQFERGAAKPKASTLAQLALALNFPVGFFGYTGEPLRQPDVGDTFFRSLRRTKQTDRQQAIAYATLVSLLLEALEQRLHLPAVDIPDDLHVSDNASLSDIEDIADELRARWEIPSGPIRHVVRLLETHGIAVVRYRSGDEIDAFSAWFPSRPIVVLSEAKANFERSRFDGAHELGHLVMHADPAPGDRILERQAHRFASAFLMPRSDIAEHLPSQVVDWQRLINLKRTWGVSLQALLYRARTLGALSESAYENAMRTISRRGWRRNEPAYLGPPEQPRLVAAAMEKLGEIGITIDDLADETNLGRTNLEELEGSTSTPVVTP
jgi:Zn-dependent peptidase ImmA (M78 family)/DNA-binding XRE family transcriptional regulator